MRVRASDHLNLMKNSVSFSQKFSPLSLTFIQLNPVYLNMFCWCESGISSFSETIHHRSTIIVHFTVVCLVVMPLNRSEAKGDLVMIQTLLLFKCKSLFYHAN